MPESCVNCGAALYGGQQFCRRCGVPVGVPANVAGGEAPTQLFAGGAMPAQDASASAGTLPVRGETGAVGAGQPTAYHEQGGFQQTSPLVGQPFGSRPLAVRPSTPKRRRGLWLCALLAVFVLGAGLATGGVFLWWRASHPSVVRIVRTGPPPGVTYVPPVPDAPPVPADLGERIKEALKEAGVAGVPLPLDESGAVVSGDDTILTRTFDLDSGASFSAHVTNGNVTVVGGEGDKAVVKVVKHGGSVQERAGTRVLASESEEGIALISAAPPNGRVSVSYEIAVPRDLHQLEISVDKGDLRVSEFGGRVAADVKLGDVEFRDVSGVVRSRLMKGDTRVFYGEQEREGAQEFSVIKGNIEATMADGAGADLKAETIDGDIDVDDSFGLSVQKAPAGRHVAGRLGAGGEALLLKVTNGDIRLKK